jgi:hypothetical protein
MNIGDIVPENIGKKVVATNLNWQKFDGIIERISDDTRQIFIKFPDNIIWNERSYSVLCFASKKMNGIPHISQLELITS